MRNRIILSGSLLLVLSLLMPAGGAESEKKALPGTPLTEAETNAFLDSFFERNEGLDYFTANIALTKTGGVFKRPNRKSGTVAVDLPGRFLLDLSKSGLRILADGEYAWVHDTDFDDVERWSLKNRDGESGSATDLGGFALFLGGEAKTAEEIRRRFRIVATREEDETTHMLLFPLEEDLQKRMQSLELAFAKDARLPVLVRTTGVAESGNNLPPLVTTYALDTIATNLDGLDELPSETFVFPLTRDMEVRAMNVNGKGGNRTLPYEELKKELDARANEPPAEGEK